MRKEKVLLNKPVCVGMTILGNSKILMYDFYYNDLKKKYGPRCNPLYTDTDSLLMEIQGYGRSKKIYMRQAITQKSIRFTAK